MPPRGLLSDEERQRRAEARAAAKAAREQTAQDVAEVLPATSPADVSTRNTPTTWSKQDVESVGLLFSGLLLYGSTRVSRATTHTKDYAMQDEEAEAMSAPLARIMCRHVKLRVARKGDMTDIIAFGAAALAYGMRISDLQDAKRHGEQLDRNMRVVPA